MTRGHQRDQTMTAARFVLRKTPVIFGGTWGAANPPAMRSANTIRVKA